jgi:RNA polymerase sigma factor (TIGR02999 family)
MSDVKRILSQIESGNASAAGQLLPPVYEELRELVAAKLALEDSGQTLHVAALVHEAYGRLVNVEPAQSSNRRGHFFAAAAEAMRRILVNRARDNGRLKHGGQLHRVDLDKIEITADARGEDLLAVNEAIEQLATENQEWANLVKLRLFAGLPIDDAAAALGISPHTAKRHWAYARAWLFDALRPELRKTAAVAVEKSATRAPKLPAGPYPVEAQQRLNEKIARSIGFAFQAGRIDTTTHPFCTTLGPDDVRLTTRYDELDFTSSLFGVLHEAGHGLYEQGTPAADFGLPSGDSVSLGIHESQSRLWENHVGRSRAFWQHWYPTAQETFPQLASFPLDDFLAFLHRAEFSPIRVEADEATYDLHILLRFELERRMLNGSLAVADIPAAWNDSFRDLFGFAPENDSAGCLQDIHWSMGGLGYFATYTLGNINSAQLFAAARKDPAIAAATDAADYAPLLAWLRKNVHSHGATLDPADLVKQATGSTPSTGDYLAHLQSRYL